MATKAEVIAELVKNGIEHDVNALKADLEALLPKADTPEKPAIPADATPQAPAAEAPTEMPAAEEQPADAAPAKTAVIVCDPHGHPHRTYSLEVHGEKYRALAEQYVSVRPGWSLE